MLEGSVSGGTQSTRYIKLTNPLIKYTLEYLLCAWHIAQHRRGSTNNPSIIPAVTEGVEAGNEGSRLLTSEMSILKEWVRSEEREVLSQVKRAGKMFPAHGPF